MGKIIINGEARRKVEADIEKITLTFGTGADTPAHASENIINDCEAFLQELEDMGIDISRIHLEEDNIERPYNDDNDVSATRVISFDIEYNMKFNNDLLSLIRDKKLNVFFDIKYSISNRQAVHDELLAEAVADSREKAELIARSTGQKIIGIDEVVKNDYFTVSAGSLRSRGNEKEYSRKAMLSDKLSAPLEEESESVTVTWKVE